MKQLLDGQSFVKRKRRIWEIDFLRGFCIILMVLDHMMFDFSYLDVFAVNFYKVDNAFFEQMNELAFNYWWHWMSRQIIRYGVVFLFLFLSGISCSLTRSNANRLRKLSIAAALVTIVTFTIDCFFGIGLSIAFGILHMLALCVAVYMLMRLVFPHRNFYLIVGLIIAIFGLFLPDGQGGTMPFWEVGSLERVYSDYLGILDWDAFCKVLAGTHLYGSDSYGIFPYLGFFLLGAGTGATVYTKKRTLLPALDGRWNRYYGFVGRYGVYIYLAHQVGVMIIFVLAAMAAGYRFF